MQMKNSKIVREKGPMFLAMNHPNAFMDPVTFSWLLFRPRTRYMARGDAFKKGFARKALESMGVVPIFRLRDGGYGNIKKNLDSFETAYKLLDKNQKIMVFGEGVCVQERRLRPIQKGTAKMAFAYMDRGGFDNLKIVPVGLTYSTPSKIRGDFYVQVGEPIIVKDYYEEYKQQPGHAIVKLTALIQEKLSPLVPSLLHKENDLLIEQLQPICKRQFIEERKLDFNNLAHHQQYWEFIIDRLNNLTEKNTEQMIAFRKTVDDYTKSLEKLKLQDEVIYADKKKQNPVNVLSVILLILGFPFYAVGKVLNFVPYYCGKRIAKKMVKAVEFYSSIFFGSSALLAKLFFTIELGLVWLLCHDWYCLLFYALIKIVCGVLAVNYSPFMRKMASAFKFNQIKKSDSALHTKLLKERASILAFLGDFH